MKKIFTVILFTILLAPVLVTYCWHQYKLGLVRREVKHKMMRTASRQELALLTFHKKDIRTKLKWKHAKEFEFEHQMYDIVEQNQIADSVSYWCWVDKKESKLNRQLAKVVEQFFNTDPNNRQNQQQVVHFYQTLFCHHTPPWEAMPHLLMNTKPKARYLVTNSLNAHPPATPPPRFS